MIKVSFFSNGRLTFSVPDAEANRKGAVELLERIFDVVQTNEELLTSPEMVGQFAN